MDFYETPQRLQIKARHLNLGLQAAVDRGDVELLWQPQRENVLDELAHRLIGAVRRRKVRRLFIDGLGGFLESATSPQRVSRFFSCLTNELRAWVPRPFSPWKCPKSPAPSSGCHPSGVSALLENLVFLRFVERGSSLTGP